MMYFYSAFNHVDQFFKVLSDIALGKVIITKVLVILSWTKNSSTVYHSLSIVTEAELKISATIQEVPT